MVGHFLWVDWGWVKVGGDIFWVGWGGQAFCMVVEGA